MEPNPEPDRAYRITVDVDGERKTVGEEFLSDQPGKAFVEQVKQIHQLHQGTSKLENFTLERETGDGGWEVVYGISP